MEVNFFILPHIDSGGKSVINFYVETDKCLTQFYEIKKGSKPFQIDNQTDGCVYDVKDLDNNPDISYIISIGIKSDISDNNIINLKSEVKKWLTKRINVFGLYKHEYYNEKEDFQFKVGLGVKL